MATTRAPTSDLGVPQLVKRDVTFTQQDAGTRDPPSRQRTSRRRTGPALDFRVRQRYLDDDHDRTTIMELATLGRSGRVRPFLTFDQVAGSLNFRGPLTAGVDLTNWPEWEEERPE